MELPATSSGAGALDVGDNLWRGGKVRLLCEGSGVGNGDIAVGLGEEGVDLGGLLCDGGEGATLEGAFGAGVGGGGNGFWNGL